jgi:hypothetical protein
MEGGLLFRVPFCIIKFIMVDLYRKIPSNLSWNYFEPKSFAPQTCHTGSLILTSRLEVSGSFKCEYMRNLRNRNCRWSRISSEFLYISLDNHHSAIALYSHGQTIHYNLTIAVGIHVFDTALSLSQKERQNLQLCPSTRISATRLMLLSDMNH